MFNKRILKKYLSIFSRLKFVLQSVKNFYKESVKDNNFEKEYFFNLIFKYNKKTHNMYKSDTLNSTFANQHVTDKQSQAKLTFT